MFEVLFRGDSLLQRKATVDIQGLKIETAALLNFLGEEHAAEVAVIGKWVETFTSSQLFLEAFTSVRGMKKLVKVQRSRLVLFGVFKFGKALKYADDWVLDQSLVLGLQYFVESL